VLRAPDHIPSYCPSTLSACIFNRLIHGVLGLFLAVGIVLFLIGCHHKDNPVQPTETFRIVAVDSLWVLNAEQFHRIVVGVSQTDNAESRSMICQISGGQTSTHFRLYDDGGFGRWHDSQGFADTLSGDQAPGDGLYTRMVTSKFTQTVGDYELSFYFLPPPYSPDTVKTTIHVRVNRSPQIQGFHKPDSIHSGVSDSLFSASVFDSNGVDDIVSVKLVRLGEGGRVRELQFPMISSNGSTWTWPSIPSIATGLPTGMHYFTVRAADRILAQSNGFVESDSAFCWLENLPPRIISVLGPDTVYIPTGDTVYFHYTIDVRDDQGIHDQDSLLLILSDPNQEVAHFAYFDDGTGIDSVANDGRFTAGFSASPISRTHVLFTFTWTPTDRSPQRGEGYQTSLILLPQPNGVIGEGKTREALTLELGSLSLEGWESRIDRKPINRLKLDSYKNIDW
jgi:hypothetical protein